MRLSIIKCTRYMCSVKTVRNVLNINKDLKNCNQHKIKLPQMNKQWINNRLDNSLCHVFKTDINISDTRKTNVQKNNGT